MTLEFDQLDTKLPGEYWYIAVSMFKAVAGLYSCLHFSTTFLGLQIGSAHISSALYSGRFLRLYMEGLKDELKNA